MIVLRFIAATGIISLTVCIMLMLALMSMANTVVLPALILYRMFY